MSLRNQNRRDRATTDKGFRSCSTRATVVIFVLYRLANLAE